MSESEHDKLGALDADMSKQLNSKMDLLNSAAEDEVPPPVQGHFTYKKTHPPRTLP